MPVSFSIFFALYWANEKWREGTILRIHQVRELNMLVCILHRAHDIQEATWEPVDINISVILRTAFVSFLRIFPSNIRVLIRSSGQKLWITWLRRYYHLVCVAGSAASWDLNRCVDAESRMEVLCMELGSRFKDGPSVNQLVSSSRSFLISYTAAESTFRAGAELVFQR